ncbi:MAG: fructose-1,6-bisphosphatase [Butyrivibrio sp.]|nr:fructose-1,6-bisphosphatase [Acetatifactor muris]MCM1559034.1 fructose-1,6-bisphosphatase [Butyrivibrio sp.]
MDKKYLELLSEKFPTIESAASEIINLSAIRSLPKGTEYFFSDLHGEYEAFLYMLKSASGMIKIKIDKVFGKTVSSAERTELVNLIYYPERELKRLSDNGECTEEWQKLTIYRLILVCEAISAKYTRSRVRKSVPEKFRYIVDELLNVTDDVNKDVYFDRIIRSIMETGITGSFITTLCRLIQSLAIDRLHIIGDIFDRGPRPDIILDELMNCHDVDIQWGNHDISWIGAACGNLALIANVIRISIKYNNFDLLEDGYGLNLRALAVFAREIYGGDDCAGYYPHTYDDNIYDPVDEKLAAQMHKAITVIQLKLESRLISAHREWEMGERDLFSGVDFASGRVTVNGRSYSLKDGAFPTVDARQPAALSPEEARLMEVLKNSFLHSEKLQRHIRFLLSHGAMYKVCNGNLMFHGCIPMDENAGLQSIEINGRSYSGKALLDEINLLVNAAYFSREEYATDFLWYLWCGAKSPLYGKDKMALFERYFIDDKALQEENYNSYYRFSEREDVCRSILRMFSIGEDSGHIINGHIPVKIKDGESPVKADGKLYVIDGGISKAYQRTTGIAGYTLIYDSHSLILAEHKPFKSGNFQQTPEIRVVEKLPARADISDTDKGEELLEQISDLRQLLNAYLDGSIKEKNNILQG